MSGFAAGTFAWVYWSAALSEFSVEFFRAGKRLADASSLPPVTVLRIAGIDEDGELFAHPVEWDNEEFPAPQIMVLRGKPVPRAEGA